MAKSPDKAATPNRPPYDEPSKVIPVEDTVVILGPDSVNVTVTPEAAEETAKRLAAVAKQVREEPEPRRPEGE